MKTNHNKNQKRYDGTIDVEWLKIHIIKLITVEETEAPVLSFYLNKESNYCKELAHRVLVLRSSLLRDERRFFEEALSQIETFLSSDILPTTKGIAVFARGGSCPFITPLQFQVPLPNSIGIDSTPNIYELVELKDKYHRYVVMISTEEYARILEVNIGAITKEFWSKIPELSQRVGSEWSRDHYQNHRRDRGDRFIKEKIQILDQLMTKGGHTHLILAGKPWVNARVRGALPKRHSSKLIDIAPADIDAKTSDIVAVTLARFIAQEEREPDNTAALLLKQIRTMGPAVGGTIASLKAFERGQVDMLVMADTYKPLPGWGCKNCDKMGEGLNQPVRCPRCLGRRLRQVNLKEEMVRLSEQHSTPFEIVRHSDTLMKLGGVGCLLRYARYDQAFGMVQKDEGDQDVHADIQAKRRVDRWVTF